MRFLIQHTEQPASITTNFTNSTKFTKSTSSTTSTISHGCIIYVGFHRDDIHDHQTKIEKFISKIQSVKLFRKTLPPLGGEVPKAEGSGKINSSLTDTGGSIILVPNFTLYSRNQKGSSVDYTHSASFADGQLIRDHLLSQLHTANIPHVTGSFGAEMHITATINGPINHIRDY